LGPRPGLADRFTSTSQTILIGLAATGCAIDKVVRGNTQPATIAPGGLVICKCQKKDIDDD